MKFSIITLQALATGMGITFVSAAVAAPGASLFSVRRIPPLSPHPNPTDRDMSPTAPKHAGILRGHSMHQVQPVPVARLHGMQKRALHGFSQYMQ